MNTTISPEWLAVDWGTTNMRVWAMSVDGQILAERAGNKGVSQIDDDALMDVLLETAEDWITPGIMVVACGLIGARESVVKTPLEMVPCAPPMDKAVRVKTKDPSLNLYIIPGVAQQSPPDGMRGEETQIAGFMALNPGWDGVIATPGTQNKWSQVSAGEIVSFQSFLSGEMFAYFSENSSISDFIACDGWDEAAFIDAVDTVMSKPETLFSRLFSLRVDGQLNNVPPETLRARLSGMIIGAELAAARPYWLGQQIAVIGSEAIADPYVQALHYVGADVLRGDADKVTCAGLAIARNHILSRQAE